MRIEVAKIKEEVLELSEDFKVSKWDLDRADIKFIKNIHIGCRFIRTGKEIVVDGCIDMQRMITCSRCLNNVEQAKSHNFQLSYSRSSLGNYLDLNNDLREEVIFNLPMKVLCKPDCKGICPGCGVNLNFEQCKCLRGK